MFDVKTKRVYESREPRDGIRVLVMRFWPRGVKKNSIDEWLRELGTDQELIRKGEKRQDRVEGVQRGLPKRAEFTNKARGPKETNGPVIKRARDLTLRLS